MSERTGDWSPQRALLAIRYHTHVLLQTLLRLELPLSRINELRRSCVARRSRTRGNSDRGCWRRTAIGGFNQVSYPQCPAWSVFARTAAEQTGDGNKLGEGDVAERFASFYSVTIDETMLVAEIEAHACAALRHLACASNCEVEREAARAAAPRGRGAGRGHLSFRPVAPVNPCVGRDDPGRSGNAEDQQPPLGSPKKSCRHSDCQSSEEGVSEHVNVTNVYGNLADSAFSTSVDRLAEIVWAFFVYVQSVDALVRGDVLRAAGWCVRFLGVGRPWPLRRLQEVSVSALELAAQFPTGVAGNWENWATSWQDEPAPDEISPETLAFFQQACVAYLHVPVIPRLEPRLRASVAALQERELLKPSRRTPPTKLDISLASVLSAYAESPQAPVVPQADFNSSAKDLEINRSTDEVYCSFRQKLVRDCFDMHFRDECALNTRELVIAGAESVMEVDGAEWSCECRRHIIDVLGSVPQSARRTRKLSDLEVDDFSAASPEAQAAVRSLGRFASVIGMDDVKLDLGADLQDLDFPQCLNARRCSEGLFCDLGSSTALAGTAQFGNLGSSSLTQKNPERKEKSTCEPVQLPGNSSPSLDGQTTKLSVPHCAAKPCVQNRIS